MAESSEYLFTHPSPGRAGAETGGVPGLRVIPGWLGPGACTALLECIDSAEWSTELRRRVQHYGRRYDYGRRGVAADPAAPAAPPLPGPVRALATRLIDERVMDAEADQAIVNEYLPGQGIGPHVDCVPCFGPVVASVSLGSACDMDFTDPAGGAKIAVRLTPGSLCVMSGPARYEWRHGIAARKSDPGQAGRVQRGRRVSVTLRTVAGAVG
ncbi:alpha-ketoglutarate-dependent dioxygenase AlkB [Nocardiopsis mangrovi]|uniref:Alpha-ketoglutarate-dependent dioxygenase AlkB n=1 Tax=Nocardiopsis mangrovi TaxID=1179818 RepID=A0ABV9DZ52_9ACTN